MTESLSLHVGQKRTYPSRLPAGKEVSSAGRCEAWCAPSREEAGAGQTPTGKRKPQPLLPVRGRVRVGAQPSQLRCPHFKQSPGLGSFKSTQPDFPYLLLSFPMSVQEAEKGEETIYFHTFLKPLPEHQLLPMQRFKAEAAALFPWVFAAGGMGAALSPDRP